ncbi:MAG: hypothetical protein WAV50_00445 [Minisyncoccia bacterium]
MDSESKVMMPRRVRVSIGNLAWYTRVRGTLKQYQFGILNPEKMLVGSRQYQALGGGAMLTEAGKSMLEDSFGASDFELDPHTGCYDARFRLDERDVEPVFKLFSDTVLMKLYERNPVMDIIAELTGKEFAVEYGHILPGDRADLVQTAFVRTVRQEPSVLGADTSERALAVEMPTRRLFRIYELIMSDAIFAMLRSSPAVRFLTEKELKTTDGGSKAGVTDDGHVIRNNLFWVP